MTLQGLNDAKHWRDRAAEMRLLSAEMKDFEARTLMLKLANDYDKLAGRAEERNNRIRRRVSIAKLHARRIAANIAKSPELLRG